MQINRRTLPLRALYCRPLMLFAALFGIGMLIAQRGDIPLALTLTIAGLMLIGFLLCWLLGKRRVFALLAASGLFLGAAHMTNAIIAQPQIETQYSVRLSGTIADDPYVDDEQSRLTCQLTNVCVDGEVLGCDIRLYLNGNIRALEKLRISQNIETEAHLWHPDGASNPGEFDFSAYLWRNGMAAYATAKLTNAEISGTPSGAKLWLSDIRRNIGDRIDQLFPRSDELVRALVLGDRRDMSEDLRASFNQAGVAHVLSVSGLHITLVAMTIMTLLGLFLPKRWSFFIALIFVVFYGVLVGMGPSVLRSILMYAALGLGQIVGRPSDAMSRLSLAFLALLVWNPLYLSDAGFVLSFSASAGMILLTPSLSRAFRLDRLDVPNRSLKPMALLRRFVRYTCSLVCATLAAQLSTLPAVVAYYGTLPILATISNLIVVPLTLWGMLLSIGALCLSAIWLSLGALLAPVPDLLMALIAQVTRLCANLPLSEFNLPAFPGWLTAVYICLILSISELSGIARRARSWLLLSLPAVACAAIALSSLSATGLKIVFLDAGQADAAVIHAQGSVYLVDVGLPDSPTDDYLDWAGVSPTAVFLSHPHEDHAGGLAELLVDYVPETIYVPAGWYAVEADDGISENIALAETQGSQIVELSAGDIVPLSKDVRATVLYPEPDDALPRDANGLSMLLLIEYGEGTALFTGDLPSSNEPGPMPDVDILKIAHHGSKNSSSLMTLNSTSASVAIISVGADNSYGHPNPALLERLERTDARIYRTDQRGAITAELLKDGGVRIYTQLAPEDEA